MTARPAKTCDQGRDMKQRLLYRSGLASACLLLAGVMLLLWTQTSAQTSTSDEAAEAALTPRLKQMLQVMKIARARHLLKPENPEMIDGAIRGMLARLDPEAELYTPSQMRRLLVQTVTPRSIGLAVKKQAMPPRS